MARSNGKTVSVNFKGIEGRGARTKPGEYLGEVAEVSREKGKKDDYLAWVFDLDEGGKAYFNTSLSKKSLWNLRGLLEALGVEVEDDEMELDLKEYVGMRCGIVIENEEYEGKTRPKMVDYFPETEDSESKDKKKSDKKSGKKGKDAEPEKLVKSDVEEMDRDGLLEVNTEHDLGLEEDDYKDNKKGNAKLLEDVLEKLDESDLLQEEKSEKKSGKKKGKGDDDKLARSKVEDMDQDELADVVKEHKLKVDLDDYKSLRKMVKAVIDELEEKDLLED